MDVDQPIKICRRELLIPGELLPDAPPGKHHGTVTKTFDSKDGPAVVVKLTDFRRVSVTLPLDAVLPCLLPKQERAPRVGEDISAPRQQKKNSNSNSNKKKKGRPKGSSGAATGAHLLRKRRREAEDAGADDPVGVSGVAPPPSIPQCGPQLLQLLRKLESVASPRFPPGTRLWVKVPGSGWCPAVAWSFGGVKRKDRGQLAVGYKEGLMCVRFYGEHSSMWVSEEECRLPPPDESELQRSFRTWGRQRNQLRMVELALEEVLGAHREPAREMSRMSWLYDQYLESRQALDNCYLCRELGARLECTICDRLFHPVCLREPAVSEEEILFGAGGVWCCPCCGEENKLRDEEGEGGDGDEEWRGGEDRDGDKKKERMGLTPDWLIEAAAFQVFQLERPHARRPYIPSLLDPCTNSKLAPNIPAEKLYDKRDNGLKLSNTWGGYYVLLNPDFSAQVQWRFVNRCIDEVENGTVPAAVLICRNSTDTAYFQRLRPYPRVMLRRTSARFKDYDKTPIGFGIAVFCIAVTNCRPLYERFFDALEPMGEPNVPVDRTFVESCEYLQLLERLRDYADQHHRDHWVQCSACDKWRIVDYKAAVQIGDDDDWNCSLLRPPHTGCGTPLSKRELIGGRYAAGGADLADMEDPLGEHGGRGEGEGGEDTAVEVPEEGGGAAGVGSAWPVHSDVREGEGPAAGRQPDRAESEGEGGSCGSGPCGGVSVGPQASVACEGGVVELASWGGSTGHPGAAGAGGAVPTLDHRASAAHPLLLPPSSAPAFMQLLAPGNLPPWPVPPLALAQLAQPLLMGGRAGQPLPPPVPPALLWAMAARVGASPRPLPLQGYIPAHQLPPSLLGQAQQGVALAEREMPTAGTPALPPAIAVSAAASASPLPGMLLQGARVGVHGGQWDTLQATSAGEESGSGAQRGERGCAQRKGGAGGGGDGLGCDQTPALGDGCQPGVGCAAPPPAVGGSRAEAEPLDSAKQGAVHAKERQDPWKCQAAGGVQVGQDGCIVAVAPEMGAGSNRLDGGCHPPQERSPPHVNPPVSGQLEERDTGGYGHAASTRIPSAVLLEGQVQRGESSGAGYMPQTPMAQPAPRGEDVVCDRTLRDLVTLPPRNITLDREDGGDGGQVLTALELARQARIAANRAYLAGLGLGPQAMHGGSVQPLPPNDPVMLKAARELAFRAAAEEARRQLECMRQRYETARRRRARLEPALLKQVRELAEQESEARRELGAAEEAVQKLCPPQECSGAGEGGRAGHACDSGREEGRGGGHSPARVRCELVCGDGGKEHQVVVRVRVLE